MEMRASQVIKGALGGGAKRKKKDGGETERGKRRRGERERHLQIHIGVETEILQLLARAAAKRASNVTGLTSSGAKGRCPL